MSATKILWGQILVVSSIVLDHDLGRDPVDGLAARLSATARDALGSILLGCRSIRHRPSFCGGTGSMPMRLASLLRAR